MDNIKLERNKAIERLSIAYEKGMKEQQELIDVSKSMIDEYKLKILEYENKIKTLEEHTLNQIISLIEPNEYKETATQLSFKTPRVKIIKKKSKQDVKIVDPEALIECLKNNQHGYIKVIEKPDWIELKKDLVITENNEIIDIETGLIIEGVGIEEKQEKIQLKLL